MIPTLTARLGGRCFTGHLLAALILDDPALSAAARVRGDELDHDAATAWLRSLPLPAGYALVRPSRRHAVYRLTSSTVLEEAGDAATPDPERVGAAAPAILAALSAAYPDQPVSGTDIRDDLRIARRSPPSERRGLLLDLADALRAAHPLGAAHPHPVLGALFDAGQIGKFLDRADRVVWLPPGSTFAPNLNRLRPYGPRHEPKHRSRHEAGRAHPVRGPLPRPRQGDRTAA